MDRRKTTLRRSRPEAPATSDLRLRPGSGMDEQAEEILFSIEKPIQGLESQTDEFSAGPDA